MTAQQLKNSILQMAVQGKLVPQDPNDEPASVLLERIQAEKRKLIKEGKIKKEKNPSVIFRGEDNLPYEKVGNNEPVCIADEVPFEIPENWEWVRLGNLLSVISDGTHKTPNYVMNGVPFLSVQNISSGKFDFSKLKYITMEEHNRLIERIKPQRDDILFCRIGTLGKAIKCTLDFEFSIFVSLGLLRPIDVSLSDFLVFCINSPLGDKWIQDNKVGGGTHTYKINLIDIPKMLIPIPPIEEQKRIFERLSLFEPFFDEYSIKESSLTELNTKFPSLLKKSILQEAVQGKLVPQDPSDETASVLLERIRAEKQALIKAGKIKKDKHESIIYRRYNSHYEKRGSEEVCIDDEIPFEIPENWEWCKLGSITTVQSSKRVFEKDYVNEGIPFFRSKEIGDLYRGEEIHTQLFITREHYKQLKRDYGVPQPGDILITSVGTIGNSWICDGREFYYKDGNITQIRANNQISSQYIQLFINSPLFTEQAQSTISGTAYNALTIIKLKNMLIPLPPLPEQRRIVEKQQELYDKITLI